MLGNLWGPVRKEPAAQAHLKGLCQKNLLHLYEATVALQRAATRWRLCHVTGSVLCLIRQKDLKKWLNTMNMCRVAL